MDVTNPPANRPPIPSPFDPPAKVPRARYERTLRPGRGASQALHYALAAFVALVVGAAEYSLISLVGFMPVTLLVLGIYYLGALGATLGVARAGNQLGWRVQRDDLPLVRRAVDRNMKCAYVMLTAIWPFMVVTMVMGSFAVALPVMALSVPLSVWNAQLGKRFKAMPVEADAAEAFAALVAAWKEARFGLKKESAAHVGSALTSTP